MQTQKTGFFSHWTRLADMETLGGIVMLLAALLALIVANSGFSADYFHELTRPVYFGHENVFVEFTVKDFVQNGLMVLFFLFVGMELKYEMQEGALAQKSQRRLPLIAAAGGVVCPALIYLALTGFSGEFMRGWAIPTATDIAFALCIMSLAGKNVPTAAKIFLMALAIIDDLFGILVLAFVYSHMPLLLPLLLSLLGVAALVLLNRKGVQSIMPYLLVLVYVGICFHAAGLHTTLAGVITGCFVPLRGASGGRPLKAFVHFLHPWVAFLILPVFAFVNAGINLEGLTAETLFHPVSLAVFAALLVGKPLGIFSAVLIAAKTGMAKLPDGLRLGDMVAIGLLAGIGFTLSFYFAALAFEDHAALAEKARLGVLFGSVGAGIIGFAVQKLIVSHKEV